MGLIAVVVFLVLAALAIEAVYRLALAALIWAPPLFFAVWAMHTAAGLHLSDPLAPLFAFFVGGVIGRIALGQVLNWLRRWPA